MKRLWQLVAQVLVLAIVFGGAWMLWRGAVATWSYLAGLPKEIGGALIAAAATIFVSTLTVVIGRYFERKKELDALYRDRKVEIYDSFLKRFFALFHNPESPEVTSEEMVKFLREFSRSLLLWSGPEVVISFVKWKKNLETGIPTAQTIFSTEDFLLSLRKDLRHSNSGISRGFFAHLFLRESDFFLSMAKKDPNITLDQIAKMEALMSKAKGKDES
jgi:hypothetical protein